MRFIALLLLGLLCFALAACPKPEGTGQEKAPAGDTADEEGGWDGGE